MRAYQVLEKIETAMGGNYCYTSAVHTARECGGFELYNSNRQGWGYSRKPAREFFFIDGGVLVVTASTVYTR